MTKPKIFLTKIKKQTIFFVRISSGPSPEGVRLRRLEQENKENILAMKICNFTTSILGFFLYRHLATRILLAQSEKGFFLGVCRWQKVTKHSQTNYQKLTKWLTIGEGGEGEEEQSQATVHQGKEVGCRGRDRHAFQVEQKKDLYRREGKGRRCCLGGRTWMPH